MANASEDRQPDIAPLLPIQNRSRNRLTNKRRKTNDKIMRAQPRPYRAHILRQLRNDCREQGDEGAGAEAIEGGDKEEEGRGGVPGL